MRAYVGVTDIDWYLQLAVGSTEGLEVNFWFPSSGQGFEAIDQGEFFVFKTHKSNAARHSHVSNRIVGVGMLAGFARLRISEAWEWFGEANGVASIEDFRDRVRHYRRMPISPLDDPEIGCVILDAAMFFPATDTLPAPDDFSPNIVRGKRYNLEDLTTDHPVGRAVARYLDPSPAFGAWDETRRIDGPTRGEPRLVVPRVGQGAFNALTAEAYHHRCALTGDKVRPVLEAAHILPVSKGGEHRLDNGLLLRSDIHTLFDKGYIGLDLKYRLRVSPALRDQFGNGDFLYSREGSLITVPDRLADRPHKDFLEWHAETVFLGGR